MTHRADTIQWEEEKKTWIIVAVENETDNERQTKSCIGKPKPLLPPGKSKVCFWLISCLSWKCH